MTAPATTPKRLTNGERIGEALPLRQFVLIAEDGGFAWVQALNGAHVGEYLTFERSSLREV